MCDVLLLLCGCDVSGDLKLVFKRVRKIQQNVRPERGNGGDELERDTFDAVDIWICIVEACG